MSGIAQNKRVLDLIRPRSVSRLPNQVNPELDANLTPPESFPVLFPDPDERAGQSVEAASGDVFVDEILKFWIEQAAPLGSLSMTPRPSVWVSR